MMMMAHHLFSSGIFSSEAQLVCAKRLNKLFVKKHSGLYRISMATTTTTTTTTTKRIICLAILFVILLLPLSTHEVSRGGDLCKGSNDDASGCVNSPEALSAGVVRKAPTRRTAKSKFKFHKIERTDNDDDDDNNAAEEENENDDGNDNNSENVLNDEQSQQNDEQISNENEDDEDNNNDNDNDDNDNEPGTEDEEDDEEEVADKEDNGEEEEETPSLFSRLLAIFTSDANETATERVKEKEKAKVKAKENQSQYPNIIEWFHWLTDLTGSNDDTPQVGKKKEKQKIIKSDIDWLTYLKRWPFNSIFPAEQSDRKGLRKKDKQDNKQQLTTGDKSSATSRQQQSKSEEYMELLIHSLPAFIGNVAQVKNGECHQQLQFLHQQLRSHKLWTLQMLDATGKIGAGLLRGNINQFGDFDQCTQVSTSMKATTKSGKATRVQGKYCLAQIEMRSTSTDLKDPLHLLHGRGLWHAHLKNPKHFVPRYSIANWGICLPHACSANVVHTIIETSLRPYNDTGMEFLIDVRDEHCTTKRKKNLMKVLSKDNNLAMGIFGIATLGFVCVLSGVWEHWDWISAKLLRINSSDSTQSDKPMETEETDKTEEVNESTDSPTDKEPVEFTQPLHLKILNAFSPQRTWQSLVSLEGPDIEFPLIHLLKILATFMIYVNLKFIMAGHLPITNRDAFVNTVNRSWSLAYRIPLLYSDLLLLLSGFLVAHKLSNEMETTCRLSFLRNVATKACRYVPSILAVLGFQTWILPHLGAGPLWNLLVGENARLCEENMWRSALNVQNTADMEEMCSPLTVQLSLDMQLYFLGALVVWLYFTDPEAGFFLCGAFHAISVAARFSRTQRDHLAPSLFHGIHVSKFYRTANLIYISPITRATTYLLGIGAGLLFRSESGIFRISPRFNRAGWALATMAIAWCFWAPASGIRSKYVYKSSDAAAYLAWSPLILGLGICWSILMAPLDKRMVQRYPIIARSVLLLSRLEIPLQLASYVVVLWSTASVKEPHQFVISDLINIQEIAYIVIFAVIVAFLIDFPAQEIGLLILEFNFSDPLLPNIKENAGESSNKEDDSSDLKSDSPEPVDSIWPSESDPEDEKSSE